MITLYCFNVYIVSAVSASEPMCSQNIRKEWQIALRAIPKKGMFYVYNLESRNSWRNEAMVNDNLVTHNNYHHSHKMSNNYSLLNTREKDLN